MTYNKKNPIARLIMRSSVKKRLYFERKNQSSSKNLLHMLLTAAKQYKGTINLLLNKIKASALILIASPVFAAHFANTFGTTALDTITLRQRNSTMYSCGKEMERSKKDTKIPRRPLVVRFLISFLNK